MIFTTRRGETFDTETDFTSGERHVLQKLFIWKDLVASVEEFRRKKQEALLKGWNNSGPLQESPALRSLTRDLEEQVALRFQAQKEEK
jgi:hypothetical protein